MRSLRRLLGAAAVLGLGCVHRNAPPGAPPHAATGTPCSVASECPTPPDPCSIAACDEGICRIEVATAGVVSTTQKIGDCLELVCDGAGRAVTRDDRSDTPPDDHNDCTEELCNANGPQHRPLPPGDACGEGGICNGAGLCGVCLPGKLRCEKNGADACGDDGQWAPPQACAGAEPACSAGRCVGVTGIATGAGHSCALLTDGTGRCWGADGAGQADGRNRRAVAGLGGVVQLAIGDAHACALGGDGKVRCWGSNASGELGDGGTIDSERPVEVLGIQGAVEIAAGAAHSCARLGDGTVWCWGDNRAGQLGDSGSGAPPPNAAERPISTMAARIAPSTPIAGAMRALVLGGDRSCALGQGGSVTCWGATDLRPRPAPPAGKPRPVAAKGPPIKPKLVRALKKVRAIALGGDHGCAVLDDASVWCWGDGKRGQLGDGILATRRPPTKIAKLAPVVELALGREHSCARHADGQISCWGADASGQLGDGDTKDRKAPAAIAALAGARALVASGDRTCAIGADAIVECWGEGAAPAPAPVAW